MVIVNGVIKKEGGKLTSVDAKAGREVWDGEKRDVFEWKDVSKELVRRREGLQEKVDKIDMVAAKEGVIKGFYIDERIFVDSV
jgi:hypothetical protein